MRAANGEYSPEVGPVGSVVVAHSFDTETEAQGLIDFVDAAPTPFHACGQAAARLRAAGFTGVAETDPFPTQPGAHFLVRGGALIAWDSRGAYAAGLGPAAGFRVVGAHTDSPNLRIKPRPDHISAGWQQLGVEPYGGLLLNSWLDRDLGLAGRAAIRAGLGAETRLFHDPRSLLRVPQLAIHLDRTVNERLELNKQLHMEPVWGVGDTPTDFRSYVGEQVGAEPGDVLGWDVMTYPTEPSARLGLRGELVAAPRLDNLATSYAAVRALIAAAGTSAERVPVVVL
ncbi:MAG: M18 family aminopeptidase, partial [Intrasporangium sp.]|nr:M18 family aminopeptidase [Intrasporangium sp.]